MCRLRRDAGRQSRGRCRSTQWPVPGRAQWRALRQSQWSAPERAQRWVLRQAQWSAPERTQWRTLRQSQWSAPERAQWQAPGRRLPQAGPRERGFSLVEVLVAVVIVSIGLLGVGELALTGLREGAAALTRTQAVYLLNDMIERIRANPDARDAYDCASYVGAPVERGCAPSGAPAIQCTARELAEDDLARWQSLARDTLPSAGTGAGACHANVSYLAAASNADPARYRVELSWPQPGSEAPVTLSGELLLVGGRAA